MSTRLHHDFRRGDRVRIADATSSELGTVLATGALLDDHGGRIETVRVLWPTGASRATKAFADPLTRWHPASDLEHVTFPGPTQQAVA